jgi:hypothetical protein
MGKIMCGAAERGAQSRKEPQRWADDRIIRRMITDQRERRSLADLGQMINKCWSSAVVGLPMWCF